MNVIERLSPHLSGRYRIERELGHGGMATVYLAEDVRHRRHVAIKVLHPELSAVIGPERFLKEIELTAALQHPHILPLFDSGSADGLLYYVMPFVDGETLRARLEHERQLPVADALRIATEVASALDYAHARGIVHRDIKPENILLQSGSALVADFGIALAVKSASGERLTQTGLSLGTPQYMSPEQATGERGIDHRADIYALGAVTFEMLAGQPPFVGPSAQSILAQVMTEDAPSLTEHRRSVTPATADAVRRALEKLPADRWNSAQEFASALVSTDARPAARSEGPDRGRMLAALGVALALACGLAAWGWLRHPAQGVSQPPSRLSIVVPAGTSFPGGSRLIDIAADGSRIVYYSNTSQTSVVELHDLDAVESKPVKGTESGLSLHLAPDGRTLFFGGRGQTSLYRVNLLGGSPAPVPGVPSTPFIAHSSDGTMWYSITSGALFQLGVDGTVRRRFAGDTLTDRLAMLQVLPSGREALVKQYDSNDGLLYALDLTTGRTTQLLDFAVAEARYADGFLIFVRNDGRLNAMPFDLGAHRPTGSAVQIAEDVSLSGLGMAQFAVAANGTIAYVPTQPRELLLVDRSGLAHAVTDERRSFHQPRFSPDGKSILVDFATADGRDVWLIDRATASMTRVTSEHDAHDGSWAPDGKSILYASVKDGVFKLLSTRPGSGVTQVLLADKRIFSWPGRWMPDGKSILTIATNMEPNSGTDIVIVDSAKHITPVVVTPGNEGWTDVSPDGRWVAYTSDRSGQSEVYVRPLYGDDQIQVSLAGGSEPMWSHSGHELFYRATLSAHPMFTSAVIRTSPSLAVTSRKNLFAADDYDPAQPHSNYDVSPDGQTFVMVHTGPVGRIVVIQNLSELVRRLQGSAKAQ